MGLIEEDEDAPAVSELDRRSWLPFALADGLRSTARSELGVVRWEETADGPRVSRKTDEVGVEVALRPFLVPFELPDGCGGLLCFPSI